MELSESETVFFHKKIWNYSTVVILRRRFPIKYYFGILKERFIE
jgi:hypothetical protein